MGSKGRVYQSANDGGIGLGDAMGGGGGPRILTN